MSNIECLVHNSSPIMFICLDNNCRQKLFCFKCCQQFRKEHSFVKFTDFMQNLEALSNNNFILDQYQISANSTQQQQKEDFQSTFITKSNTPQNETKASQQQEESLIQQCFQGINNQLRRDIVKEESEKIKQNLQLIYIEYIDELFDNAIQEFAKSLEKTRQTINNQLIEYLENTLNTDTVFSNQSDNKVAQIILEINKASNYQQLNESLINLHQGQLHLQINQEKIAGKLGDLNQKLDEFFAQIQNRITFGLNSCVNVLQTKQVNSATAAAIKKLFQSNIIQKNQPGEYKFSLRQPKNYNSILQSQITQQSSMINSGYNSSNQGNSQRISFRIKNQNQKKIDNFLSLSPTTQLQKTKSNSIMITQGNKITPTKRVKQITTEPSQISPHTQHQLQLQNTFLVKKKSTFHSKEEETNDLKKFFTSQSRDETCVTKQQQKKQNQSNGQLIQQKLQDGTLIQQMKINPNKILSFKIGQSNLEKPLQFFQNDYKVQQEDYVYRDQQKKQLDQSAFSNTSQQLQQSKQVSQLQLLKKTPKNQNLINYKIEAIQVLDPQFDDTLIQNSMIDENSKTQEKNQSLFSQFQSNLNNNCVENIQNFNYFKRNSNQIQHVVDNQKQNIKQKSVTESCSLVIINQSENLIDCQEENDIIFSLKDQSGVQVQNTYFTNNNNFSQNIKQVN
ncbi:hypothetical protein TTHERM_00624390 (macronuclear) [Tetrahymena thermophila SB210]|uniref:Uncharacterized protein n=1 Tax=Tetrahymena thermophila (strain SB210) TaxID=312017 RepID=Q240U4_TETTS|nr:hypothetical protein TTHERM_00624390 [Tetrahymena thermophila SB210]EAS02320.1 hypothetical protein TTHERM_00624390 [Tetrahymena thermophila SB210]|eukprot:XP_001022565.1 hypothetical protein TTHERM_00624390 [Tetrahymena thermophila SB210]